MNIPEGINYKFGSSQLLKQAKETLKQELKNPDYVLFEKYVYCGPKLWKIYSKISLLNSIQKGNITFRVFENGQYVNKKGKLIQTQSDFKKIWDQIIIDFNTTDLLIRKLQPNELTQFWAIISYDIVEPIYVLEGKEFNLIIDLSEKIKILFVEAI